MAGELPIDASLQLSDREFRTLQRAGRHRWVLPAAAALVWVIFWSSAWYRVSKLLSVGAPGIATVGDLLALDVKAGTTYDAFQVLAITTIDQIANDFRVALILSIFTLGIHAQQRLTLKLWRAFRAEP